MTALTCVGAIAGAFGVRGEVRLKSFCAEPDAIADYAPLTTEDGSRSFGVTLTGTIKNGLSARLSGVATREDAERLKGLRLYAPRDRLPSLPDDEFYHADLIGLDVFDTGGTALGRVHAVHDHGAGDILEITGPGLSQPAMLPFTRDAVPTVDLEAGRIITDPPEGIFSDTPEDDARRLAQDISRILREVWNPRGLNAVPKDEYSAYEADIAEFLDPDRDLDDLEAALTAHLKALSTDDLGLDLSDRLLTKIANTARALTALMARDDG